MEERAREGEKNGAIIFDFLMWTWLISKSYKVAWLVHHNDKWCFCLLEIEWSFENFGNESQQLTDQHPDRSGKLDRLEVRRFDFWSFSESVGIYWFSLPTLLIFLCQLVCVIMRLGRINGSRVQQFGHWSSPTRSVWLIFFSFSVLFAFISSCNLQNTHKI